MTTLLDDEPVTSDDFPDLPDLPPGPAAAPPADDDGPSDEAPYGWTTDRKTGARRPRQRPGRPKKDTAPPGPSEIKDRGAPPPVPEDKKPPEKKRPAPGTPGTPDPVPPMPRGGVIAAGVNKLYRRAGRIVRGMDHDIGQAIIECTRPDPEDPDWITVGQAWEELAKSSPGIRAWLLKAIAGGAWGDLVMAHAPIGLAIFMKPAIMRLIPFRRIAASMMESDDDDEAGEDGGLGGLDMDDVERMAEQAGVDLEKMAEQMARKMGAGQRQASQAAFAHRAQPRHRTRSSRKTGSKHR